jgi:hypothetical protein
LQFLFAIWIASHTALGQPLEVVVGQDLAAWSAIDENQLAPSELATQYSHFIEDYPTSSLAEVALSRVQQLRGPQEPTLDPHILEIEQSQRAHAQKLERDIVSSTVITLNPDGSRPAPRQDPWHTAIHAGANWMNGSFAGLTGAEFRYRPVGVVTRIGVGETVYLQSGLRVTAPGWGPFGELSYDTRGATSLVAGGRQALKHKVWLELSGGVELLQHDLGPLVRLELVHGL